ncbi:MAG: maleylpyruvate isomerase N-terminal domain-containing protein, partial [Nocardioidaceae bacterium]
AAGIAAGWAGVYVEHTSPSPSDETRVESSSVASDLVGPAPPWCLSTERKPPSLVRRGFGRIEKRSSGRYRAAYTGPDAHLYRAPMTFDAKDDAIAWLAARRAEIEMRVWAPEVAARAAFQRSVPTLREYADNGWRTARRAAASSGRPPVGSTACCSTPRCLRAFLSSDPLQPGSPPWRAAATPCEGWDLRALVSHLVSGNRQFAAALRGEEPAQVDAEDDLVAAFEDSGTELLGAFARPGALQTSWSPSRSWSSAAARSTRSHAPCSRGSMRFVRVGFGG